MAIGVACSDLGDSKCIGNLANAMGNQEQVPQIERGRKQVHSARVRMKGLLDAMLHGKEEHRKQGVFDVMLRLQGKKAIQLQYLI